MKDQDKKPGLPMPGYLLLLGLVIGAAGLGIWLAAGALANEGLDGATLRILTVLLLLVAVGLRTLRRGRRK